LFLTSKRYAEALKVGSDPIAFVQEIAKAGYATSPIYFEMLVKMVRMIERNMPDAAVPARRGVAMPPGEEELPEIFSEDELRILVPNWPKRRVAAKRS